jgi:glutaredoxin 3
MYVIYSKPFCPFCVKAENFLRQRGISYAKIDIGRNPELRDVMIEKSGGRKTVPQIFDHEDNHIGGFDDLEVHLKDVPAVR